jgi:hypothetical protein
MKTEPTSNETKLDQVLENADPSKRTFLKRLVLGSAIAAPIVASFSATELANAQVGSFVTTITTVGARRGRDDFKV